MHKPTSSTYLEEVNDVSYTSPEELARLVAEPFIITFTAHLPFPVCIPNDLGHRFMLDVFPFKTDAAKEHFGPIPYVNLRVYDRATPGLRIWQKGVHEAIRHFYGTELTTEPDARYGEDSFLEHDQWITLETPYAAIEGEDPLSDPNFAFHRCLRTLNLFMEANLLITGDVRIRTISSQDLRPAVVVGVKPVKNAWYAPMIMMMHPDEAYPDEVLTIDKPFDSEQLNSALYAIFTNRPYRTTMIWRARAQRALRQTGDAADAILSFQIAAESLVFDSYRMILVDEGRSASEIAAILETEIPFKSLLTRILPSKLGGQWDVTRERTAVGRYWKDLYLVRNAIIHRGEQAHNVQATAAHAAYSGLRDHLEHRLWAKHRSYPRTLLARLEKEQLEQRGLLTRWMREFIEKVQSEPAPYYLPYDLAGRQPSSAAPTGSA